MSILYFNLFIILFYFLRKSNRFIINFSIIPLIILTFCSIFKLFFSFEFKFSKILFSENLFTIIFTFLRKDIFTFKSHSFKIYQLLILLWILGSLFFLAKYLLDFKKFKKYIHLLKISGKKIDSTNLNLDNNIEVYVSEFVNSPLVTGNKKATIFIPDISFTNTELKYILAHEFNHYKSSDNLKKLFFNILKILYWWNPFIYIFSSNINQILEIQCDLKTIANYNNEEKINYLECIHKVIENSVIVGDEDYSFVSTFVNVNEFTNTKQRFEIVLTKKKTNNYYTIILSTFLIVMYLISNIFIIQPIYFPEDDGIYTDDEVLTITEEELENMTK